MTTQWAQAGKDTVVAILFGGFLWLYYQAVIWRSDADDERDQRKATLEREKTLLAIADYLETRERQVVEDDSDDDLGFLLRRSIELTEDRGSRNDAA